jgi:predicted O-methyltransferase YrrM
MGDGLNKVSKALGKPARWARNRLHRARYDHAAAVRQQERGFAELGLARLDGLSAVEKVLTAHPELAGSMKSEHHVLFGAISCAREARRILEIGTYDGKGTALLAHLFPAAQIETIDLPDDHAAFIGSYRRQDDAQRRGFIAGRNELLRRFKNVSFVQTNSASLSTQQRENYDLIWVDGDHGYPIVAIDVVNAVRLIGANGFVLCDDVRKTGRGHPESNMYGSVGAYQTLCALQEAGSVRFMLVQKRLDAKSNADPHRRKFIAVCGRSTPANS